MIKRKKERRKCAKVQEMNEEDAIKCKKRVKKREKVWEKQEKTAHRVKQVYYKLIFLFRFTPKQEKSIEKTVLAYKMEIYGKICRFLPFKTLLRVFLRDFLNFENEKLKKSILIVINTKYLKVKKAKETLKTPIFRAIFDEIELF